jgi:hypothetical protein
VDAAALLAQRQQVLAAVQLRLRALEQEQQQLLQNRLRLEGAIEVLQALVDAAAAPDGPAAVPEDERGSSAALAPSAAALPWERA